MKARFITTLLLCAGLPVLLTDCDSNTKPKKPRKPHKVKQVQKVTKKADAPQATPETKNDGNVRANALRGEADSQYKMGELCEYGSKSYKTNMKKAVDWYAKSAAQGNAKAACALALLKYHRITHALEQQPPKAEEFIPRLQEMAQAGDAEAMFRLALCYGTFLDKNRAQEEALLKQAVEKGHLQSKAQLAKLYYWNDATKDTGKEMLTEAAQEGSLSAMESYAQGLIELSDNAEEQEQGRSMLREAAAQRDPGAMIWLGKWLMKGNYGFEKDPDNGEKLLLATLEQGLPGAYDALCSIYLSPDYGKQNFTRAVRYAQQGTEAGDSFAMTKLGICYLYGHGVEQSDKKAYELFSKAAAQNCYQANGLASVCEFCAIGTRKDNAKAENNLRDALILGDNVAANFLKGLSGKEEGHTRTYNMLYDAFPDLLRLIRERADKGNAECQWVMARLLTKGSVMPRDEDAAMKYLIKGADGGNMVCQREYGSRLLEKNDPSGIKYLEKAADQGDSQSQYMVGMIYFTGMYDVRQSRYMGENYLRKAARQGNADAIKAMKTFLLK